MTKHRIQGFIMYLLYYVCSTNFYLRLNGYEPDEVGAYFEKLARRELNKAKGKRE